MKMSTRKTDIDGLIYFCWALRHCCLSRVLKTILEPQISVFVPPYGFRLLLATWTSNTYRLEDQSIQHGHET